MVSYYKNMQMKNKTVEIAKIEKSAGIEQEVVNKVENIKYIILSCHWQYFFPLLGSKAL